MHELDRQIRETAGSIYMSPYKATVEQAEELAKLILERSNVRIILANIANKQ